MLKVIHKIARKEIVIITLLIVSLGSVYYLLLPGFYEPQDLHHIADIYQMHQAFVSGQFPPRWGPDYLYGLGYPLFNFYYLMPFYLGALFYTLTNNLRFSFEAVIVFTTSIGTIGFYLFLRNHFSKISAILGAVVFTYTPYRAVQIFVRGSMGELLAISLMPWIIYLFEKYLATNKYRWFIYALVASVSMILSHNYFWVLIFGFIGLYILIRKILLREIWSVWKYATLLFFSLGATAFWWLPALYEQNLLKSQTPFLLIDHFPFIKQLLTPYWGYGASVWGPDDGMSFQLGLINISFVIISVFLFVSIGKSKKNRNIFGWSIAGFILCLFFMNIRSLFLWKLIPFYNFFQFAWRLLAFTGFFSSIMSAYCTDVIFVKNNIIKYVFVFIIVILTLILTGGYFKPSRIFYKSDNEYLKRMFAEVGGYGEANVISQDYRNYSEDYLLLPKWMESKPDSLPPQKFYVSDAYLSEVKNINKLTAVSWEAVINTIEPATINFYSMYFPGWFVFVDDKQVEIKPGNSGQITFLLDKGEHQVKVNWLETPLRKASDIISLIFILGIPLMYKVILMSKKV